MSEVKAILGQFTLTGDDVKEDLLHNTDLIALRMNTLRIGVRVRKYEDMFKYDCKQKCLYSDEFTIRYRLASKRRTEFSKIMGNWGEYFFYGFESQNPGHLAKWFIGDFEVFRNYVLRCSTEQGKQFYVDRELRNPGKNDSSFLVFKKSEISDIWGNRFIVADSDSWMLTDYGWFNPNP